MTAPAPKPVEKCFWCGADCDWCLAANQARLAFPRATRPPMHDADTEHICKACFLDSPGLVITMCNPTEEP